MLDNCISYTNYMKKIKAIISDADGTLVNTLHLIRHGQYEAAVDYLIERDIPRSEIPYYDDYEKLINLSVGGSTRETFEKTLNLLFKDQQHHLGKINFDELNDRLKPIQDRLAPLYVHPYYWLNELFAWLGETNRSMAIFTSGSPHHIVRNFGVSIPALGYGDLYRQHNGADSEKLGSFIQRAKVIYNLPELIVITAEDVSRTKPNPEGINYALDKLGLTGDEVLIMGDHPADMEAGNAAGISARVGVSHGFSTHGELIDAGAIAVIDNLSELPALIELIENGSLEA
jgi:phosphoglycolate phosphatase-like HAD superfamily hydrolase